MRFCILLTWNGCKGYYKFYQVCVSWLPRSSTELPGLENGVTVLDFLSMTSE